MSHFVNEVMTPKIISIPSGTTIQEASDLMSEKRIRHLVVVDRFLGEAIGIVSERNIISLEASGSIIVDEIMSSPIVYVEENTPVRSALFKILENKISALLITDDKQNAIGIATTDDFLWYLAHLLENEDPAYFLLNADRRISIGKLADQLSNIGI